MPILPTLPEPVVNQYYLPVPATKEVDGKEVAIPQEEQAWVKLDASALNVRDYVYTDGGTTGRSYSVSVLTERIKDWNYTEKDGTPIPITEDNVIRIGKANLLYLYTKFASTPDASLDIAEKKN